MSSKEDTKSTGTAIVMLILISCATIFGLAVIFAEPGATKDKLLALELFCLWVYIILNSVKSITKWHGKNTPYTY